MNSVERNVTTLINTGLARIATSMETAGLRTLVKTERGAAPRGKTKQTAASIGKRITLKARGGIVEGKAGVNVAKSKAQKTAKGDPHNHLVTGGSKPRYRKVIGGRFRSLRNPTRSQLSTGTMPGNDFINQAANAAVPAIINAMTTAGTKAVDRLAKQFAK